MILKVLHIFEFMIPNYLLLNKIRNEDLQLLTTVSKELMFFVEKPDYSLKDVQNMNMKQFLIKASLQLNI